MSADTVMLTFDEAAEKLAIKPDSVRRRARNRGWHRIIGNDGLARVAVPVSALEKVQPLDTPPDVLPDIRADIDVVIRLEKQVSVLETEARMLREQNIELKADRDEWKARSMQRWWRFWAR